MLTEQQLTAIHSVDKNVLVSAGAGSGKTHVLVERYVEILRKFPDITLGNIIAVTYTRKAASEMRSRLKARFLTLSKDPDEGKNGNHLRWLNCLSEVDSARIGTIHSQCESILKAYPADSGIDPEFEVLDELTTSELLEEAINQALRDVIGQYQTGESESGESSWEYALLLSYPLDEIKGILASLIRASMQFDEALKAAPALTADGFIAHAENFISQVKLQELASLRTNRAFKRAFDYARANVHPDAKNHLEVSRQDILLLCEQVFAGGAAETLASRWQALIAIGEYKVGNVGGNKPEAKALRDNLKAVRETAKDATAKIPLALAVEDEPAMNMAIGMIQLYQRTQVIYQAAKSNLTALDYNDLISRARACLHKDGSQAKSYFNEKVRALLVDEFQDTNDVQAELLAMLAGPDTRVFLIGDDKQSIYKFQGADVATFNRWKQRLSSQTAALAGESMVTKLTKSFRSHPAVVAFVNAIFSKLLDGDPDLLPYVAAFEALEPARATIASKQPVVAGGAPSTDGDGDSDANAVTQAIDVVLFNEDEGNDLAPPAEILEACHVAHWIKSKVDGAYEIEEKGGGTRPIAFGDFAVLVLKNKDFDKFEEVFARTGIPYVAFGGQGFLRRQEVTDFENLFRFLDNPKDSHSLLAVLRSPLCPLTDDLIHNIAHSKEPLWVLLTQAARQRIAGYQSIMQAVRLLRTMLDYAALLPLGELVHKIITLTRYDLVLLAADDGKQRSRNVWKIAHLARENEHLTCGEFAQKLSAMRDYGMKEGEAPLDSGNSVKLMTVHASKGLEFPAVALPCLGGQLTRNPRRLIFHRSYGVAFNTKRLAEDIMPSWYQVAAHFDKKTDIEERKRLLYVAMTRARDCLGLFIIQDVKRNTDSYRKWLRETLGLIGDDVSIPDHGSSITLNVPGGHAGAHAGSNAGAHAGTHAGTHAGSSIGSGVSRADFALTYWFGFPPLDLNVTCQSDLPQPVGRLDDLMEEPAATVFEAPINELALVRLTPSSLDGGADFAISSPRVIGTFFHALMENLPKSKIVDREWVRDIAYNQGFHFVHPLRLEAFVDEGMRLLTIYYESPLRELVDGAHRCFNEMPYLMDSDEWVAIKRPDLIVESKDGQWFLIDFKTDKFQPEQIARQVRKHREQLQSYVQDLRLISGIELKAALYFAQFGSIEYIP
jgi:ATP-dependent helicase/nuclease subunit A